MSDNLFLPETPPPVAPKPEPVIKPLPVAAPSDEKNLTVPFALFAHPPADLEKSLEDADCFSTHHYAIMQKLFACVDFNETVRVEGMDLPVGWTCVISYEALAKKTGMSRRHAIRCVKDLVDAKLLDKQGVPMQNVKWSVNRFRITIYDSAIAAIIDDPNHPKRKMTALIPSSDSVSQQQNEMTESDNPTSEQEIPPSDCKSPFLEYKDLRNPRLTVSDGLGTNEESEKRGGDINLEDKDSPKEKTVSPRSESRDIVPTAAIGKAKEVDKLVESIMGGKQGNTKPPEDGIEPFIDSFNNAFNLESVAVLSQAYVEPALALQKGISSKLSAAGLALPVNRFLEKYLVPCVHESLADGTLDELPRAFGFFLRKPKGKQVLDRSVGVAKSSNSVTQSVERTKTFLGGLKGREPVPESSKERVSDMIANIKPISADETKRLRRLRE